MTFQPTHRTSAPVKFPHNFLPAGTLLEKVEDLPHENLILVDATGDRWIFAAQELDPISQEEPAELEPGKRYRWTVEGTITEAYELRVGDQTIYGRTMNLGVLEPIPDPLPTTPGSVVWTEIRPFMLGLNMQWADEDGDHAEIEWLNEQKIVRTFDAGDEK
jgi:hypothetical protein